MKTIKTLLLLLFGVPLIAGMIVAVFQNASMEAAAAKAPTEKQQRAAESAAIRAKARSDEKEKREREAFESEIASDGAELQDVWRQNPDIPKEVRDMVRSKKIRIGLPTKLVRLSWGDPKRVNTTTTANGTREQWVYESSYVYFEDGKVTAISQSKGEY